ncbi:MAG: HlyD family secretion protein [Chloroflexia bacterium]|nr:HlyD family secretion protein [Chloroflexia bacterium]
MATGKSVNLRVRPTVSVDLSFPTDGLISRQSQNLLGNRVSGFDVEVLYGILGQTIEGDSSKLEFDSGRILNYLQNANGQEPWVTLLSQLRSAPEAADLDRTVMMRQNAYLTSYSPEVLRQVRRVYYDDDRDDSAVRYKLLRAIESKITQIHTGLTGSYKKHEWYEKIILFARTRNTNDATQYTGDGDIYFKGTSTTDAWGYEFRFPSAEADMRYLQSRAAVRQEFLNAWRMAEMCRFEDTTFPNEVGAIDRSIQKLQSAYIDTFLFSPFDGIVTGVFHGQGDYVRAGEPVLRVESDEMVYLVGTVKYRGMLRIGDTLKVSTTLFEAAGAAQTSVSGEVVAVRGHDSVSEQWDLLIRCGNRTATGGLILPLNYNFDFESTTVEVTTV